MNRLLVPPSSFYNPNGPSSMGLGSGVNGTPSIQQAALMMHHHHQQQQQQQNAAHSQGSQMPSEKLAIGSSGFKIATSLESTATTHHFPRQITSVSSTGFDLAAAVSAARSSQAAAAAAAMHAPPTSTVSLGAPPNFNPNQQPLHVPTHNMLFPQPTHPAAAAALFSAGHPGAAGIHPLLAAAAASGHFPGYHSPDGFGPMDFNMITRRKNATRETTSALKAWLNEHKKNPYPTKGEKIMLAIITKMTLTQVSTWFANARRRLKKENKMTWAQGSSNNDCDEEDEEDDDLDDDLMDDDDKDARRDLEESFTSSSLLHQLHTAQKPSQLGSHFPTEDLGLRIETNVPNPNKRSSSADALTFSNLINSTSSLQPNSACHESDPNSPTSRSESDVSSQSRSRNRHLISTPLQVVFPNNNKPISNTTGRKDSKTDTSVKKSKIWSIADLAASPSTSSEISTKSNCQNSPASFTSPVNQMSPIWKSPKTTLEGFPDHLGPESANILKVENFYGRSHMGATAHPGFYPGYGSHASPGAMSAAISAGFHPTFPSPVSVAMFNFANSQTALPKNF